MDVRWALGQLSAAGMCVHRQQFPPLGRGVALPSQRCCREVCVRQVGVGAVSEISMKSTMASAAQQGPRPCCFLCLSSGSSRRGRGRRTRCADWWARLRCCSWAGFWGDGRFSPHGISRHQVSSLPFFLCLPHSVSHSVKKKGQH